MSYSPNHKMGVAYDHIKMVEALTKPGADIVSTLTPETANLWHLATGVAGEAGELLDAVKKAAIYNKPLDRENAIEELGDIEFYLGGVRAALNISRDDVLQANINKLQKRYAKGYSDEAAQARADKELVDAAKESEWVEVSNRYIDHDLSVGDVVRVDRAQSYMSSDHAQKMVGKVGKVVSLTIGSVTVRFVDFDGGHSGNRRIEGWVRNATDCWNFIAGEDFLLSKEKSA